jgi:hypothetical protein
MSEFVKSFESWWNASKAVVSEAGNAVVETATDAGSAVADAVTPIDERVAVVMDLRKCSEAEAIEYLKGYDAGQNEQTASDVTKDNLTK